MKTYKSTITISQKMNDALDKYLHNPSTPAECLSEDDGFVETAEFENGYQMDIKCCGVQFHEGEDNSAWTEAVLFDTDGNEVTFSEPSDEFTGEWELNDHDGNTYIVTVTVDDKNKDESDIALGMIRLSLDNHIAGLELSQAIAKENGWGHDDEDRTLELMRAIKEVLSRIVPAKEARPIRKKYELAIWCSTGSLIYYKTSCRTANAALIEFYRVCAKNDINIDNIFIEKATLRDQNDNDVDEITV